MKKERRYADLHCHSAFMSFLWRSKPRRTLRQKIMESARNRFAISLTNSASDIDKLITGDVRLISASLYAIEKGFSQLGVVRFFLFFMTKIDAKLLRNIRNGKLSYNQQIRRNIAYIKKAIQVNPTVQFRLLNNASDFIEDDKVNVVLSVEGSHALFSDIEGRDELSIWSNLEFLKNENTVRIFYMTLVHIQQNTFANHAFGVPPKALRHRDFYPKGDGISTIGFELIKRCLDNKVGRSIYIDVKHMSLKSRIQYYEWRAIYYPKTPIIASHMGVTGCSFKSIQINEFNFVKDRLELEHRTVVSNFGVKFNNWSINLYDEEIVEILNSDGLIGLSLDVGILGANNKNKETFSALEFSWLKNNIQINQSEGHAFKEVSDIDYFVNNLVHILNVANSNSCINVLDQICIGSDFDGLIAPIYECQNVLHYRDFESLLILKLKEMQEKEFCQLDFDVELFIENLMYKNYRDFLLKYL
jgi:microsomal dipeptidase-like Zn-dependent dipeptidase